VLQSVAARNPESLRLSSRERIARLEGEIAGLWSYVQAQKLNGPAGAIDSVVDEVTDVGHGGDDESDSGSEMSDASPADAVRELMTPAIVYVLARLLMVPDHACSQRTFSYFSTTVCLTHKTSESRCHGTHAELNHLKRDCLEQEVRSRACSLPNRMWLSWHHELPSG